MSQLRKWCESPADKSLAYDVRDAVWWGGGDIAEIVGFFFGF